VLRLDYVTYRGLVEDTQPLRSLRTWTSGKLEALIHVLCKEPPADGLDLLANVERYYKDNFSTLYAYAIYRSTWRPIRAPEPGEEGYEEEAGGASSSGQALEPVNAPAALQTELSEALNGGEVAPAVDDEKEGAGAVAVENKEESPTEERKNNSPRGSSSPSGSVTGEGEEEEERSQTPKATTVAAAPPPLLTPSEEEMQPVLAIQPGSELQVLNGMRMAAMEFFITATHVRRLTDLFSKCEHIVEVRDATHTAVRYVALMRLITRGPRFAFVRQSPSTGRVRGTPHGDGCFFLTSLFHPSPTTFPARQKSGRETLVVSREADRSHVLRTTQTSNHGRTLVGRH